MARILINDGIHPTGEKMLKEAGHEVVNEHLSAEILDSKLSEFDAICVRSATKVRTGLIDKCPNLKIIARGGVGLDNIDVAYAKSKGIEVYNTPAASTRSVAELAITHMLNIARGLNQSNRMMPIKGDSEFKALKKSYSKGVELEGKNLGIIGFGRIGQELASIGLGMGMNILPVDKKELGTPVEICVGPKHLNLKHTVNICSIDQMLEEADFISLHVPSTDKPILGESEMSKMKNQVIVVNTARGGAIDEDALLAAIANGKIKGAGLDVFVNEPNPRKDVLDNSSSSFSPHIGASTLEAQEKIGIELANQINNYFK